MLDGNRCLVIYSDVLTAVLASLVLSGFATGEKKSRFDEIEAERINIIVEPDATLRMVLCNKARLPGVIVRGKEEHQEPRPYAGTLFYNNQGSETAV
jgi:hypothetical protein